MLVLNAKLRGQGVGTEGWLDGVRVRLKGQLFPAGSAGVIYLMPARAE